MWACKFRDLCLVGCAAITASLAAAAAEIPEVITRYEQMLERSPEPGIAFDKVYQHFLDNEGLEALASRWLHRAESSQDGSRAAWWLAAAFLAERRGHNEDAERAYEKAAAASPADYHVWSAWADFRLTRGQLNPAAEAWEKALETQPPASVRMQLYRKLATTWQRLFKAEAALATWKRMADDFPDDPFALEEVGAAQLRADKLNEARATFGRLLTLISDDPFRKVTVTMRLAEIDERQGNFDAAIGRYESMLAETGPTSWMNRELRRLIEDIFRRQDDLPGLVHYYERRLQASPKEVNAHRQLAEVYFELNRKDDGLATLERAVGLAPEDTDLQRRLAERYRDARRYDLAVQLLDKLAREHPDDMIYVEQLGHTHWAAYEQNQDAAHQEKALESWSRLSQGKDASVPMMVRHADILRQRGLAAEASRQLRRAIDLDPDNNDLREHLAIHLREAKFDQEAESILAEMVAGSRATAENYLRQARLLRRFGKDQDALAATSAGLAINAQNFDLLSLQWSLLADAQRWKEASELFRPLLATSPNPYFASEIESRHITALQRLGTLAEVRKSLADRIAAEDPALDEADYRLLIRACLAGDDQEATRAAVESAQKRFPHQPAFIRLEADFCRQIRDTEKRVAALRRLLEAEPARRADCLREIALAYRDAGQIQEALTAASDCISHSPAAAEGYVLYADLCFACDRDNDAIEKLRQAIRFSDRPNDIRLRLARYFLDAGKGNEAIATYEEAFEAEQEPSARLALMKPLAEAYFQMGRSAELIERFQRRQRAEAGGWRYAMYLAAIHSQMQDFGAARRELSRALADRSRDPDLLRQLVRLAEGEGNTLEQARYQELLTELEPSTHNKLSLAMALLANGDADRALAIARENQAEFLSQPESLRDMVMHSDDPQLASQLAEIFSAGLRARRDDWQGRLTLAEFCLADGDFDAAAEVFWEILAITPAAQALSSSAPLATGATPASAASPASPGVVLMQRLNSMQSLRQMTLQRLLGSGYTRGSRRPPSTIAGIEGAQDAALINLALISLHRDRVDPFLAKLEKLLDGRNASARERLIIYGGLERQDKLIATLRQYLQDGDRDNEVEGMAAMLLRGMVMRAPGAENDETLKLLDQFYERAMASDPTQKFFILQMRFDLLARAQHPGEADRILDEALAAVDLDNAGQLAAAISMALRGDRLAKALELYDRAVEMEKSPSSATAASSPPHTLYLTYQLLPRLLEDKLHHPRALALIHRHLEQIYKSGHVSPGGHRLPNAIPSSPRQAHLMPIARHSPTVSRGLSNQRRLLRTQQGIPSPNDLLDSNQVGMLQQLFNQLPSSAGQNLAIAELARQEKQFTGNDKLLPRLARAYFLWWSGDQEESVPIVSSVRKAHESPSLRITEAGMLIQAQRPKEAIALLNDIPDSAGEDYLDAQCLILHAAKTDNDAELSREVAERLANATLDYSLRMQAADLLRIFGLSQEADQVAKTAQPQAPRRPADRNHQLVEDLNRVRGQDDHEQAIAVARRILADNPFNSRARSQDHLRRQAIQVLRAHKGIEPYMAEIKAELDRSPLSPRFHLLLAEAYQDEDIPQAIEHWLKVAELRPLDFELQRNLGQMMVQGDQAHQAIALYNRLLARDPETTLARDYGNLIRAYTKAGKLDQLAEQLLEIRPSPINAMRGGSSLVPAFVQLGHEFKRQDRLEEAVNLWMRGCEHGGTQDFNLINLVVQGLVQLDRQDEVMSIIERAFFPDQRSSSSLFNLQQVHRQSIAYLFNVGYANRELTAPGLSLIDMAKRLGALRPLLDRANVALKNARDAEETYCLETLRTLLLIELRDPSAKEGLPLSLSRHSNSAAIFSPNQRLGLLRLIASRLKAWPEARSVASAALEQACEIADTQRQDYWQRLNVRQDLIALAAESGNRDQAQKILRETTEILLEQSSVGNRGFQIDEAFDACARSIELGFIPEANRLAALIRKSPPFQNNNHYRKALRILETEIALLKGELSHPQCVAWLNPETASSTAEVAYEIGPIPGDFRPVSAPRIAIRGGDIPKLAGRFDVELLFGSSPDAMRQLALIRKAPPRGTWRGPLPAGIGYLRTIIRDNSDKGALHFGPILPVSSFPNLIPNPLLEPKTAAVAPASIAAIPDWDPLSPAINATRHEGPAGPSLRITVDPSHSNNVDILSKPIPIDTKLDYLQSAWIRCDREEGQHAQLGRRYLDAKGKTIDTDWCPVNNDGVTTQWQWHGQPLLRDPNAAPNSHSDRIPKKAAFVQILLRVNGGCELWGLSLRQFSLPPDPLLGIRH